MPFPAFGHHAGVDHGSSCANPQSGQWEIRLAAVDKMPISDAVSATSCSFSGMIDAECFGHNDHFRAVVAQLARINVSAVDLVIFSLTSTYRYVVCSNFPGANSMLLGLIWRLAILPSTPFAHADHTDFGDIALERALVAWVVEWAISTTSAGSMADCSNSKCNDVTTPLATPSRAVWVRWARRLSQ
ncbi:MAG: hypothetical protein R3C26_12045 [Calditrichia bacterium]